MYILELNTILPHKKSRDVQFDFVRQIHKEIDKNINIQMFNKAFVGIVILTPSGYANGKPWDTDNRALNLVFNNLKGKFFQDDDFTHMSFGVFGAESTVEKTIILIDKIDNANKIIFEIQSILDTCKMNFDDFKESI